MSREILFRGKIKDIGMWVYGSLINNMAFDTKTRKAVPFILGNTASEDVDSWDSIENGVFEVDPKTVGQYTGLDDEKGIKIFEGDLYKTDWGFIFKVVYLEQEACFAGVPINHPKEWVFLEDVVEMERVGNVHDNPELLEVK